MGDRNSHLREIINRSGFPLQVALESAVAKGRGNYRWRPLASEVPWFDELKGEERFIDLLLTRDHLRLIVECKRRKEADWVFLVHPESRPDTASVCCRWVQSFGNAGTRGDWSSFPLDPETPESQFCAIRGASERQTPMLERVASELIRATEFMADPELGSGKHYEDSDYCAFVPVIATTARLSVCRFDPGQIPLETGVLPTEKGQFVEVPAVRFSRSMLAAGEEYPTYACATHRATESIKTVFVINTAHFVEQIESFRTPTDPDDCPWMNHSA